jgi:hypothetical protein
MKHSIIAALAAVVCFAALPAQALTFHVAGSGPGVSFNVQMLTSNTLDGLGGYDITGISGTDKIGANTYNVSGLITGPGTPPATGLFAAPNGNAWNFNDVIYPADTPKFDNSGPLWTDANGDFFNLYTVGLTYLMSFDSPNIPAGQSTWNPGVNLRSVSVSQTPLPGALPLFASVLGFCGWVAKRRKKDGLALLQSA